MRDVVKELASLLEVGLKHGDAVYTVLARAFICDMTVRAFLKCTKRHAACFACKKCTQKGVYSAENRKVIYPNVLAPLHTDEDFSNMVQPNHHNSPSQLLELGVELVSKFLLEYMHLVCIGAMKGF